MSRLSRYVRSLKITSKVGKAYRRQWSWMVKLWRPLFMNTTVIGITGSHGKTTATRLLHEILATQAPTAVGKWQNELPFVRRTIMRARPWRHRFLVQEISGHRPQSVKASSAILKPSVGVVTGVSADHRKAFGGSIDAIAAEKMELVLSLPKDGLAVLNADDPRVAAMASACPCRVVTFGSGPSSDLRLVSATSIWPERLSLVVDYKWQRIEVPTRLVGEHWTVSVLAAMVTALELGVRQEDCVKAIGATLASANRMSVHKGPSDSWLVMDAYKASYFGIETCLKFLESAKAPRKTVLMGTLADYPGSSRAHYQRVARMALAVADRVIFTGRNAERVRRLVPEFGDRLRMIDDYDEAVKTVKEEAIADEIIYVKAASVDRLYWKIFPRAKPPGKA